MAGSGGRKAAGGKGAGSGQAAEAGEEEPAAAERKKPGRAARGRCDLHSSDACMSVIIWYAWSYYRDTLACCSNSTQARVLSRLN